MYNAVLVRKETKVKQANVAITGTVNLKKWDTEICKSQEQIDNKFTEKEKFSMYMFAFWTIG